MHYSWTLVVVAFVAQSISAFPLGRQGIISSPVDDPVKRNYAFPITDSKYVKRVAEGELVDHEIVGPGDESLDDGDLGLDRLVSKDPDDDQTGITVSPAAPDEIPPAI